ncbi:MAG TPA: hypothetical protein PLV68_13145, partial [Ilumatobacteraceae bacterium]|nr:hypothetical protein [Ilumatobacteraceae bacterium]
ASIVGGAASCDATTEMTCTINNLTNGTNYQFTVAAINQLGTGPSFIAGPVKPGTTPTNPINLTATGDNNQVTLSWALTNEGGYPVTYTITVDGDQTFTTTNRTYTVQNLVNFQSYSFTVSAANEIGPAATSATATGTPVPCKVTSYKKPTGTVAINTTTGNNSAKIEFEIKTDKKCPGGLQVELVRKNDGVVVYTGTLTPKSSKSYGKYESSVSANTVPVGFGSGGLWVRLVNTGDEHSLNVSGG